jgi:hypothetical protein
MSSSHGKNRCKKKSDPQIILMELRNVWKLAPNALKAIRLHRKTRCRYVQIGLRFILEKYLTRLPVSFYLHSKYTYKNTSCLLCQYFHLPELRSELSGSRGYKDKCDLSGMFHRVMW